MQIQVVKPFTLTHQDGTQQAYGVGVHDVPDIVAEHWYTKLHLAAEGAVAKVEGEIKSLVDTAASRGKKAAAEQAAPADAK